MNICRDLKVFFSVADDWIVANKGLTEKTKYTISNLPPESKILVRVRAINAAGASTPRTLQHSILVKEVIGESRASLRRHTFTFSIPVPLPI